MTHGYSVLSAVGNCDYDIKRRFENSVREMTASRRDTGFRSSGSSQHGEMEREKKEKDVGETERNKMRDKERKNMSQ